MTSANSVNIDDSFLLVYTWVVYGVVCQIINLFGIVTNIINIICFTKQGFADSVNISLLGLAVSDLGSLSTMFGTCFFMTPAVTTAELPFEPVDVMYLTTAMPHFAFTRISACITAMITLERCLCITFPLKIKNIITPRRTTFTTVSLFIIMSSSSAPVYVVNGLERRLSHLRNITLVGIVSTVDRENVEMISFAVNNFLLPFGAFIIILVCTIILVVKLRATSKWRSATTRSTQIDKVSARNQKAAKMAVMISTLFIACFVPVNIMALVVGIVPEMSINRKYFNISVMISGLGYVMESINSSMNIFIYYTMSSNFREGIFAILKRTAK